jgi:hypothetical protein
MHWRLGLAGDYLVQVALLRGFAKLQPTSSIHRAQLYLLERVTEKAELQMVIAARREERNAAVADRRCREVVFRFYPPSLLRATARSPSPRAERGLIPAGDLARG